VIVPIVDKCVNSLDDILKRIDEGLNLVAHWNGSNLAYVIKQDKNEIADAIGKTIVDLIDGKIQDATATFAIMIENVSADFYHKDLNTTLVM